MTGDYVTWALEHYQKRWASQGLGYQGHDPRDEHERSEGFLDFATKHPTAYERSYGPGHFTGSALITTPQFDRVLLTHHAKLNLWVQLGGHLDGEKKAYLGAQREAEEESGLAELDFAKLPILSEDNIPLPFDVDCHDIPARKQESEHQHYDLRYLFVTNKPDSFAISDESLDLKWFSISDARKITNELSMHRQFDKLEFLAQKLRI